MPKIRKLLKNRASAAQIKRGNPRIFALSEKNPSFLISPDEIDKPKIIFPFFALKRASLSIFDMKRSSLLGQMAQNQLMPGLLGMGKAWVSVIVLLWINVES